MPDLVGAHVCVDCMYALEYGVGEAQESMRNAGIDPDSKQVPMSLLSTDPGVERVTSNYDSETGDGITSFSWSQCDGCGTHDGGHRYRVALWLT